MPRSHDLNKYLRRKRLEAGLSQRELGQRLGYKSQFVANWERGASNPPVHVLRKIVAILGIDSEELLQLLYKESMRYWKGVLFPRGARPGARKRV